MQRQRIGHILEIPVFVGTIAGRQPIAKVEASSLEIFPVCLPCMWEPIRCVQLGVLSSLLHQLHPSAHHSIVFLQNSYVAVFLIVHPWNQYTSVAPSTGIRIRPGVHVLIGFPVWNDQRNVAVFFLLQPHLFQPSAPESASLDAVAASFKEHLSVTSPACPFPVGIVCWNGHIICGRCALHILGQPCDAVIRTYKAADRRVCCAHQKRFCLFQADLSVSLYPDIAEPTVDKYRLIALICIAVKDIGIGHLIVIVRDAQKIIPVCVQLLEIMQSHSCVLPGPQDKPRLSGQNFAKVEDFLSLWRKQLPLARNCLYNMDMRRILSAQTALVICREADAKGAPGP